MSLEQQLADGLVALQAQAFLRCVTDPIELVSQTQRCLSSLRYAAEHGGETYGLEQRLAALDECATMAESGPYRPRLACYRDHLERAVRVLVRRIDLPFNRPRSIFAPRRRWRGTGVFEHRAYLHPHLQLVRVLHRDKVDAPDVESCSTVGADGCGDSFEAVSTCRAADDLRGWSPKLTATCESSGFTFGTCVILARHRRRTCGVTTAARVAARRRPPDTTGLHDELERAVLAAQPDALDWRLGHQVVEVDAHVRGVLFRVRMCEGYVIGLRRSRLRGTSPSPA